MSQLNVIFKQYTQFRTRSALSVGRGQQKNKIRKMNDLHFFSNCADLVKKNETMLIVYKIELNHFEVCISNFIFVA